MARCGGRSPLGGRPPRLVSTPATRYFAQVRTLLALALVLVAPGCSGDAGSADDHEAPPTVAQRGLDALLLRVPRAGGEARVFSYPALDSAIWSTTERVPAIDRVLGFDPEAGSIVLIGARGTPVRLDLRLGAIAQEANARINVLTTQDGSAIFGVDARGAVVRVTPSGTWRWTPPRPAAEVFPQSDGALVVAAAEGDSATLLWRIYPPDTVRVAEQRIERRARPVNVQAGDRVYYATSAGITGVRGRDLTPVPAVELDEPVERMVPTPSGDRVYLLADTAREIRVFDRYRERITSSIELPGVASDLRMDPIGRYLLARVAQGDSIWVIAVGTDELVGTLPSSWRSDLPAVAPDGAIALLDRNDVVLAEGPRGRSTRRVQGGGRDLWYFFHWNGFRPRAAGIDDPVTFAGVVPDSLAQTGADSLGAGSDSLRPGSGQFPIPGADTAGRTPRPFPDPVPQTPPSIRAFTVQFYALMVEERARELASQIQVDGQRARVVPSVQAGTPVYRVVLGPYQTREEAERVGSRAGHVFWVFQGLP